MHLVLAAIGLIIILWAFRVMFSPPRKHKDLSLEDRDRAVDDALGADHPPHDSFK